MMRDMGNRLNRHTCGDAAHHRDVEGVDRFDIIGGGGAFRGGLWLRPGDDLGLEAGPFHRFGQLQNLQSAGAVGEAADEATLFQCRYQAVDAGFGFQVQRVFHFVERGGDAVHLHPLADEV